MSASTADALIRLGYLLAAVLFIVGLKRLGSPQTARSGNLFGATGMLVAVVVTLLAADIVRPWMIVLGLAVGGAIGVVFARTVQMTAMPQMVAIFNGLGGGASALVAGAEFVRTPQEPTGTAAQFGEMLSAAGVEGVEVAAAGIPTADLAVMLLGVLIGTVTFSGSMIAWGKLQGVVTGRAVTYAGQKTLNALLFAGILALGALVMIGDVGDLPFALLAAAALVLGVLLVLPIGGADMPVVISLLNSYSGLAAAAAGFVLRNDVLVIAGALVGASGLILTRIMCQAMNRSLAHVLFGAFGGAAAETAGPAGAEERPVRETQPEDTAIMLAYAQSVIIVPGYGMAVAQAQHIARELSDNLEARGVDVKYAIHPVAGRMPGHMNVLLAEAQVSYDDLYEMETINPQFDRADVALVIGANDVVNPAARLDEGSPIYGMPILDVDEAETVVVMKRSLNPGFAGVDNPLFYHENTRMLFGDAKESLTKLVQELEHA